MDTKLTRRKMLKDSAALALGGTFLVNAPFSVFGNSPEKKSRVVLIRNENLLNSSGSINQQVLSKMLDEGLIKLTQTASVSEAWSKIIRPLDVVGIKTNVWQELRTPPELESLLKSGVLGAGINATDISINDRGVLNDPVFKRSTALINVRPARTHAWSGVGSLLKNYIMFTPQPSSFHGDSCADLAKIWEFPEVKGKTRLNILVMITPLFHLVGSNRFSKEYTWPYNGLLLGFDPVAVDAVGVQILQAKRKEYFKEDRPLNPPAKHIYLADTRHHLGTADFAKIDLVKTGWGDGIFI
ncbi:MAG: DUF362 domain-containing protein [Bacteroidales bacterium]|nr:DUF362 domain-containing protein [Bacteroidales bacterium]